MSCLKHGNRATQVCTRRNTNTAHFKLTLEVVGSETDTLTWENKTLPLEVVAARQAIVLAAFAAATANYTTTPTSRTQ